MAVKPFNCFDIKCIEHYVKYTTMKPFNYIFLILLWIAGFASKPSFIENE